MKKLVFLLIFLSIITPSCKNEKVQVKLAASKNLWNSLALIAIEKGFFNEEGLEVSVSYLDAGRFCMDAVLSKSADFGNVVDVNVGYLGYSKNTNIILIAEISGCLASNIVAKKSRGISSPNDLKGKSLAFSPGTTSDIFARRFLKKYNISEDSIKLEKIQPKGMVASIIAKDGPDASSTWEPFVSSMRKGLGDDIIVFGSPEVYTAREYVSVRSDWAKKNKEKVQAYLKALKKANDFIIKHKAESQEIVAKMTGLSLEVVKSAWDAYQITFSYDTKTYLKEISQIGKEISELPDFKDKQIPNYSIFLNDIYFTNLK